MSEWTWIDRREREPEAGKKVLILFCDMDIAQMTTETAEGWPWSHWMPIPPPPPKMVTIEISEEDARVWAAFDAHVANDHQPSKRLYGACRKALEDKR